MRGRRRCRRRDRSGPRRRSRARRRSRPPAPPGPAAAAPGRAGSARRSGGSGVSGGGRGALPALPVRAPRGRAGGREVLPAWTLTVGLRLCRSGARRRRRRRWDEGRTPRAPPEEGAARRPGIVRGGAGGATLPACCSHGHRPAAPSPRREAVCALLGTRGQPVRSRQGSVVRNELTLAGNTLPGWQRDCLALACQISSEEAQKEMFCSLKITRATGKKQQPCIEQGNHFQVIKTCC